MTRQECYAIALNWNWNPSLEYGTEAYELDSRAGWYANRAFWRLAGNRENFDIATQQIERYTQKLSARGIPSRETTRLGDPL